METKKIFIVEDDPIIASDLEGILIDLGYNVIGIAHKPFEAKKKIELQIPDLILMDINLNSEIDGIDLATLLKKLNIPIVFITAFTDKQTLDRVKPLSPLGYIIKPFNENDISVALELAFGKINIVETNNNNIKENDFVFIKTKNNLSVKILFNNILFIEAYDNYSFIYTETEKLIVSYTLKELEQRINSQNLIRVHRSYIINIKKVEAIQYNNLIIAKHEIPIGKSYRDDIIKLFPTL